MNTPSLIFVTGCNGAGKTSLIQSNSKALQGYEIIIPDISLNTTDALFKEAVRAQKDIVFESPFNDESVSKLIHLAKISDYSTFMVALFLKSPTQSLERVATRAAFQNGLVIPPFNVEHNFIENFKNVARHFYSFDASFFLYTGAVGSQQHVMTFRGNKLTEYKPNDLSIAQNFAEQAYLNQRIDKEDLDIIISNKTYTTESILHTPRKTLKH